MQNLQDLGRLTKELMLSDELVPGMRGAAGVERMCAALMRLSSDESVSKQDLRKLRRNALAPMFKLLKTADPASATRPSGAASGSTRVRGRENKVGLQALFESRWGPQFVDARSTLDRLLNLPPANLLPDADVAWLAARRGVAPDRWAREQQFGRFADTYLMDHQAYASYLRKHEYLEEAAEFDRSFREALDEECLARLASLLSGETGILLCGVHAGSFNLGRHLMRTTFGEALLPLGAHEREGRSRARVSAENPIAGMLQMVRHLRRPNSVGIIGADGQFGDSQQMVEVQGYRVPVVVGAPHIVYHARCRIACFLAGWSSDGRVQLRVEHLAESAVGETLNDWTRRWLEAWGRFLNELVTGDPRNARGRNGFWTPLLTQALGQREDEE